VLASDSGGIANGHFALVHGLFEVGGTVHLDGMVMLRRIHAYARHVGDLLVDRSPLGQICPNGIRRWWSPLKSGPLTGHGIRFQRRPGGFEHSQDLHDAQMPALHILGHRAGLWKNQQKKRTSYLSLTGTMSRCYPPNEPAAGSGESVT